MFVFPKLDVGERALHGRLSTFAKLALFFDDRQRGCFEWGLSASTADDVDCSRPVGIAGLIYADAQKILK